MNFGKYMFLYALVSLFLTLSLTVPVSAGQTAATNSTSTAITPSESSAAKEKSEAGSPEKREKPPAKPDLQISSSSTPYTTVVTLGIYPIKKNRSYAKQNATNEALKEAVEQSVTRLMSSQEVTSNLELIYDAINNHADRFIISYRILGEFSRKESSIVALESQINTDALVDFFNRKGALNGDSQIGDDADAMGGSTVVNGSGLRTIKAKIEGTDYLSSFIMLRKTLNSMNGIKDVQTRELTTDQAIVNIVFNGDGKRLAEELIKNSFDDFGLILSEVTPDSLTIRFVPKVDGQPIESKDMEGAYISE